jgi:hypothetical protein
MEFRAATAGEGELGEVKEVKFSAERGFGAARAAGEVSSGPCSRVSQRRMRLVSE